MDESSSNQTFKCTDLPDFWSEGTPINIQISVGLFSVNSGFESTVCPGGYHDVQECDSAILLQEFIELQNDPTKSFQTKVQDTLREMKKSFGPASTYEKIYPSSARPGRYYGLAKLHKIANRLDEAGIVDELPMRPVITNIGTATYELSR